MSETTAVAKTLLDAVRRQHFPEKAGWICALEVTTESGRRADMVCWDRFSGRVVVVEAKVSRQDYLLDLKDPGKAGAFRDQVDGFWYAAPVGVMDPGDPHPAWAGRFVLQEDGGVSRLPGSRLHGEPSRGLMAAFLRRLQADDTLRDLLAQERAAGAAHAKNKLSRERPAGRYTKQDLDNAHDEGFNEAKRLFRKKARKAEGRMS